MWLAFEFLLSRYGFPSVGHAKALSNIQRNAKYKNGPLGVNLGANKDTADVVEDFVRGVDAFKDVADYFVINVSSPNTPGLRLNQQRDKLVRLLTAVRVWYVLYNGKIVYQIFCGLYDYSKLVLFRPVKFSEQPREHAVSRQKERPVRNRCRCLKHLFAHVRFIPISNSLL